MSSILYDQIGTGYATRRIPDPRIASSIREALGATRSVLNVGAGAGSYEPEDVQLIGAELSHTMIAQRAPDAAPCVQADSRHLPFADRSFETALAILTMHHWSGWREGLAELRRVARERVVLFTWDPGFAGFWLTDYFPEILSVDRRIFPDLSELSEVLGPIRSQVVPIPRDCPDGFLGAYWCRPRAYLDPAVRGAISTFSKIQGLRSGLERLAQDLASGRWQAQYGRHLPSHELDLGYRLLVARYE